MGSRHRAGVQGGLKFVDLLITNIGTDILRALDKEAKIEVDKAVEEAKASPEPSQKTLGQTYTIKGMSHHI